MPGVSSAHRCLCSKSTAGDKAKTWGLTLTHTIDTSCLWHIKWHALTLRHWNTYISSDMSACAQRVMAMQGEGGMAGRHCGRTSLSWRLHEFTAFPQSWLNQTLALHKRLAEISGVSGVPGVSGVSGVCAISSAQIIFAVLWTSSVSRTDSQRWSCKI